MCAPHACAGGVVDDSSCAACVRGRCRRRLVVCVGSLVQQRQVAPCSAFDVVCRARDIAQPNTQTQPTNKGRTSRLQNCAHSRLWAIRDLFQIGHTSVASPRVMLGVPRRLLPRRFTRAVCVAHAGRPHFRATRPVGGKGVVGVRRACACACTRAGGALAGRARWHRPQLHLVSHLRQLLRADRIQLRARRVPGSRCAPGGAVSSGCNGCGGCLRRSALGCEGAGGHDATLRGCQAVHASTAKETRTTR